MVGRSTSLTSEVAGEGTKGSGLIQVLEVRSENVLLTAGRTLGESTGGERVKRSVVGLGLANEGSSGFGFRGGFKGFAGGR